MKALMTRKTKWLVVMFLAMFPAVMQGVTYNTLTELSYTSADLARYQGARLNINPNDVTFTISEDINFKEIYGVNTILRINLSNGARFTIDQDDVTAAVHLKGLQINGYGYVNINGINTALALNGGTLDIGSTTVGFKSRDGYGILCKNGSKISAYNSVVDISAPLEAVTTVNPSTDVIDLFQARGSKSHVTVKGAIGHNDKNRVKSFRLEDGYFSITCNNYVPDEELRGAISATDVNISGGKVYVNSPVHGIVGNRITISNCDLEANALNGAIRGVYNVDISNCNVRAISSNGSGIYASAGNITLSDVYYNRRILAVGRIAGIYADGIVNISNHNLVSRSNSGSGIIANVINITPQSDGQIEVYSPPGTKPVLARIGIVSREKPIINFVRPGAVVGTVPGREGNFPGQLINDSTHFGIVNSQGPIQFEGYVKIKKPHIQNITGVNRFDLLWGGASTTKMVLPGDTMILDMSPLNPYITYENPVKTVNLYRRKGDVKNLISSLTTNESKWYYTFTEADVDYNITAEVELDAYEGVLTSRQYHVYKRENWGYPTKPTLQFLTGNIKVTNAKTSQEYIFTLAVAI